MGTGTRCTRCTRIPETFRISLIGHRLIRTFTEIVNETD